MRIAVQDGLFDIGEESNRFAAGLSDSGANAGAIVTFTGVVRGSDNGDMVAMEIEHSATVPRMTVSTPRSSGSQLMASNAADITVPLRNRRLLQSVHRSASHRILACDHFPDPGCRTWLHSLSRS